MEVSEEMELDLNCYFLRPGGSDLSWQVTVLMLPLASESCLTLI